MKIFVDGINPMMITMYVVIEATNWKINFANKLYENNHLKLTECRTSKLISNNPNPVNFTGL